MKRSKGRKFRSIKAPKKGVRRRPPSNTLLHQRKEYSQAPSEQMMDSQQFKEGSTLAKSQKVEQVMQEEEEKQVDEYEMEILEAPTVAYKILTQGYIHSYIDFFYIVNNKMPMLIDPGSKYQEHLENKDSNYIQLPYEVEDETKLTELRDKLIAAERANRSQDKKEAIQGYYNLAEMFYKTYKNFQAATYFYQRCIDISIQTEDYHWESLSTVGMGQCYYKLERPKQAIKSFEQALKTVEVNNMESDVVNISEKLVEIYINMAMEQEATGSEEDLYKALENYKKCLDVAKKANQPQKEAEACQKLGDINFKLENYEESAKYQKTYLVMCDELYKHENNPEKQMKGYAGLSKCYMKLDKIDLAQDNLTKYLKLAQNNTNYQGQADASFHLAQLYQKQGNQIEANTYYKAYFNNARAKGGQDQKKNMKQIDMARVLYGISDAKSGMDAYIEMVKNADKNIKPLLDWKLHIRKDGNK